jgi:hypothetical protein
MKATNLALRLEDEPVVMAELPRLAQAVLAADDRPNTAPRPRRRMSFDHSPRRVGAISSRDEGLRIFRVR